MSANIRSTELFNYRMIFISMFLVMGITCIGIVVLEYVYAISLIEMTSVPNKEALMMTLGFLGILGFFIALIMIYLINERRSPGTDRRVYTRTIDFEDRRSGDRRSN